MAENKAFQFLTNSGTLSTDLGGIVPPPITLGVSHPTIDGKVVEVTATSGVEQYLIVEPGDYPTTQDQRTRVGSGR